MAEIILHEGNCPTNCPQVKYAGQSITHKVKLKTDYTRKDGTHAIYIQSFVNGEQVRLFLDNLSAQPKNWDPIKQRFKGRSQMAVDGNLIIEDYLKRIHEIAVQVRLGSVTLSKNAFIEQVMNYSMRTDFIVYYTWKVEQRRMELSAETFKLHKSCQKTLKQFTTTLPFHQINAQFLRRFKAWLRQKELAENTIATKIKVLKTYLNLARNQDGFKFTFPDAELKGRVFDSKIVYLTREEIQKAQAVYEDYILPQHLKNTLQYFLFSCFTGVRFGDIERLTRENIIGNYLVFVPHKTKKKGRTLKIPLTKAAKRYLNPKGPLFNHVIHNVKTNANLKLIARFIGTKTKLTFHVSRHTFATQFLEIGNSIEVLQKLMDHSNIRETMGYAHVTDKRREQQIMGFDEWF